MTNDRKVSSGSRTTTTAGSRRRTAAITCAGAWTWHATSSGRAWARLNAATAKEVPVRGNPSITRSVVGPTGTPWRRLAIGMASRASTAAETNSAIVVHVISMGVCSSFSGSTLPPIAPAKS